MSSEQKNVGAENEGMPKPAPGLPALLRQLILIKLIFLHSQRHATPSRDGWCVILAFGANFLSLFVRLLGCLLRKLLCSSGNLTSLGTTAEEETQLQ